MKKRYINVLPGLQIRLPDLKLVYTDENGKRFVQVAAIKSEDK